MKPNLQSPPILFYFLIATVALSTVSCSRHPRVSVTNEAADPLDNLIVSGRGFSESLGTLGARGRVLRGLGVLPDPGNSAAGFQREGGE